MKLLVTSDLHIDKEHENDSSKLPDYIKEYTNQNPNEEIVFAIVGDIAQDLNKIDKYLSLFKSIHVPKLFVAGNHDIWIQKSLTHQNKSYTSLDIYQKLLPDICLSNNFHYLDNKPFVYNRIGFIGNIGWYDYSFRSFREPESSNPLQFVRKKTLETFDWSQITLHDIVEKELWTKDKEGHLFRITAWNDKFYIRFPNQYTDYDFCYDCYKNLNKHISMIQNDVCEIILLTHHALFQECIIHQDNYDWEYNNSYRGCKYIGDFVQTNTKISSFIFGHTHTPGVFALPDKRVALNPFFKKDKPYWILETKN